MTEQRFTHLDESGRARMVDVTAKEVTVRHATATGRVLLSPEVVAGTRERYVEAYERITGRSFDEWLKEAAE